jgi:hypothetical protein
VVTAGVALIDDAELTAELLQSTCLGLLADPIDWLMADRARLTAFGMAPGDWRTW